MSGTAGAAAAAAAAGAAAAAIAAVEAVARDWAVPGGSIAVVSREGTVLEHCFGVADIVSGAPVRPDHLFEIGSISKLVTATVVLQLAGEGRLALDRPIAEALPWVPAALRAPGLTLERLLTHTAGLVQSVDALPDEAGQVASFAGRVAEPGRFHYSNLGYILLGLAAARAGGRPLPELVRSRVLAPLGLERTLPAITHADYDALARGTQPLFDDRPWIPGDPLVPAPWLEVAGSDGSIASTAADLAHLGRALLLDPDSAAAHTALLAPAGEEVLVLPGVPAPAWSRYGFGINAEGAAGGTILSHGGGMVGYASFLLADPATGLVVAVLTNANGDSPVAEAMARSAHLVLTGAGPAPEVGPQWWPEDEVTAGTFGELAVVEMARGPAGVTLEARLGGEAAPLLRTWGGDGVTRLPALREFALVREGDAWAWGPRVFGCGEARDASAAAPASPYPGHYRGYSPWFTNFRIVQRGDRLLLIAPGGVESPGGEQELVPLGEGVFRIGADPGLPETISFAPPVDGLSPWADRDGCRYSRSFTA